MKKYFPVLLIIASFLASCSGGGGSGSGMEAMEGTDGLLLEFLPNSPPARIIVGQEDDTFGIVMQGRNGGAFSASGSNSLIGRIFLGGYDRNIIDIEESSQGMESKFLEKRDAANPKGGLDLFEFEGKVNAGSLLAESYSFNLLATACYEYGTKAGPSVCIDPMPYEEGIEKACSIGQISLGSQGAPIAITEIEEEVLAEEIQFRITIKNAGGGRAIKKGTVEDCNPFDNKVDLRQNVDFVYLTEGPKIGSDVLTCRPSNDDRSIRLIEGEGFIICKWPKPAAMKEKTYGLKQGYTTPLTISLDYIYMISIQQPVQVIKRD